MYNAKTIKALKGATWGLVLLFGAASTAHAQGLSISDETGPPAGTSTTSLGYVAQNDLSAISVDIFFDDAVLTPELVNPGDPGPTVTGCLSSPGANWSADATSCRLVAADQIRLVFATGFAAAVALDTANPFGSITWNIDGGASVGTVVPITVQIDSLQAAPDGSVVADSNLVIVEGSVTVEGPFLGFNPTSGVTVDVGEAEVNSAAPGTDIDVTEAGTEDVILDSCAISGTDAADFSFSYAGQDAPLPATFTGGSGQTGTITVDCTPGGRGARTAQLDCSVEDAAMAETQTPSWPLTCAGLAPDVTIPVGPIMFSGTVAGADPTTTITVTNPDDGFTSTANNATATEGAGDTEVTLTAAGPFNIAPDGSAAFEVSCDSSAEGSFTRTINFTWDNPDPAGPTSGSVDATCTVSDTAPIYNSVPAPGTLLALSSAFGTQSAVDGLDVNNGNPNPAADDLVINSATASDPVFTVNVVNDTFAPNVAGDSAIDVEVTCTPEGVGTVNGTLTVETNDPNEPVGGFTYPLECTGTGDALTSTPPAGGTLNLGTVPPNTPTGEGSIDFTNNGITGNGSVTVDCTVTDVDDVFTVTPPSPFNFVIAEGATESAVFQCTPPDVSTFTANVSCAYSGAQTGTADFTVACSGRPLVIPTMSRWGLVVMSLMLLLVAGFAGRRMMA